VNTALAAVTFDSAQDYNGSTSVAVAISDGANGPQGTNPSGAVSITVTEVNDAPAAAADALSSVAEDSGTRTISFASLMGNDSKGPANESGQALTIIGVSNVIGGTASISGTNVLFTPTANFNGTASFNYTVQDNGTTHGGSDPKTATGTASFTVTAVNDAPVAANGSASGNEDTVIGGTVVATDVDNTAAQLSYSLVGANGGAQHGTVTLNPNGGFTYRPAANYNGGDSFNFRASDGALTSNVAVESLTVLPVDDPPVITNNQDDGFAPAGGPSHATIRCRRTPRRSPP
jgi:VCBS repeat-containing protein